MARLGIEAAFLIHHFVGTGRAPDGYSVPELHRWYLLWVSNTYVPALLDGQTPRFATTVEEFADRAAECGLVRDTGADSARFDLERLKAYVEEHGSWQPFTAEALYVAQLVFRDGVHRRSTFALRDLFTDYLAWRAKTAVRSPIAASEQEFLRGLQPLTSGALRVDEGAGTVRVDVDKLDAHMRRHGYKVPNYEKHSLNICSNLGLAISVVLRAAIAVPLVPVALVLGAGWGLSRCDPVWGMAEGVAFVWFVFFPEHFS